MNALALPLTDPVAIFGVVLLIILGAPLLMEKLRMPGIVGILLAGVLVGPYGLNILERGGAIELLGTVGMVYIMFLAGLETDLSVIRKNRVQGLAFGLLLFAIPFALGLLAGKALLSFSLSAVILTGAMFVSQTLVSYPIASRLGLSRTRAVTTVVVATFVADSLAMAILAAVSSSAQGHAGLLFWLRFGGLFALVIVVGGFLVPRFAAFFFRKVQPDGATEFVFVLAVLFAVCILCRASGIEPIIGAFVAGIAFNSLIPQKSALMNRLSFAGNSLFVPFFLLSTGMLVNVRTFASAVGKGASSALVMALVLVVGMVLAKFLASRSMRALFRYTRSESNLLFGLSMSHAAGTLAIVLVGYRVGAFSEAMVSAVVSVIVVTCLAGPLVTNAAAKSLALETAASRREEAEMAERVMVMVSNPEGTRRLMDLAVLLVPRDSSEPIYPVNVVQDSAEAERDIAFSEKILAQTVVQGVAAGMDVIPVTRVSYNVAEGVVQAAREARVSTIVAGAGPGSQFQKRPYGRVIDQIVRTSRQMVLVNRLPKAVNLYNTVVAVVPPLAERQGGFGHAAAAVKTLALQISARLVVLTLSHAEAAVSEAFGATRPAVGFHVHALKSWSEFPREAAKLSHPSSLFALLNVRQGSLAWQPAVDRLPSALLESDPAASILCVYLPESREAAESESPVAEATAEEGVLATALSRGRTAFWKERLAMADALRSLVAPAFPGNRETVARLCAIFMEIAQKEPVELKPGILLLHAHVEGIPDPLFFFGLCPAGIPLLSVQEPVRLLLVLVAPADQPPEEHLKTLSLLAAEVMDEERCNLILSAPSIESLRKSLGAGV